MNNQGVSKQYVDDLKYDLKGMILDLQRKVEGLNRALDETQRRVDELTLQLEIHKDKYQEEYASSFGLFETIHKKVDQIWRAIKMQE